MPYAPQISLVGGVKSVNVKSMADLAGKSVAVNRSTTQDTDLTQNAKGATVVRYDDDAGVITAVVTGQADLVGTSNALFQTMMQKAPNRQLEQKFVLRVNDLGIGVRKDEHTPAGLGERLGARPTTPTASSTRSSRSTTAPRFRRTWWRSGSSRGQRVKAV